jgi:pilus assembly protein CpaB
MKRWVAIGGAVILAVVGTLLLISYVQSAEQRAREGQELATVLVVEEHIEKGTLAELIDGFVAEAEVPLDVLAEDAVSDLTDLTGLVATTDLVPGEQVIASRFQTPASVAAESRVEVPPEFLQVTIPLEPARAVGGRLVPGDYVALIASFDPFDVGGVEPGDEEAIEEARDSIILIGGTETQGQDQVPLALKTPNSSQLIIHKILITGIQVEQAPRELEDGAATTVEFAPTGNLLITMAAGAEDVEKIVFSAEHGFIWLALEDIDAPEPVTEIRTRGNIYE